MFLSTYNIKFALTMLPCQKQYTKDKKNCKREMKMYHNIGVSVQKLDEFLQTPEAALQAAE